MCNKDHDSPEELGRERHETTSIHAPHDSLQDPHYDDGEYPYLIVGLPPLCDEAALQVAELLKEIAGQFAEYYELQIHRALHQRSLEEQRRFRRLELRAVQMDLFREVTEADGGMENGNKEPLDFNDDF